MIEHTQTFPGLTLIAISGQRAPFGVLDAGDPVKDFTVTVAKPGRYVAPRRGPQNMSARRPG